MFIACLLVRRKNYPIYVVYGATSPRALICIKIVRLMQINGG